MDIWARAKGIILDPAAEWRVIATEPTDTAALFRGYAAPLALIPAVCGFLGSVIVLSLFGLAGVSFVAALVRAVIGYALGLLGVFVIGKIIEVLTPRFGGQTSPTEAMKLSVYSHTPSWLVGVFLLLPILGVLTILGLYSLYVFWKGVPVLTRVPGDQAAIFTLAVILVAIIIYFLVGYLAVMLAVF